MHEPGPLWSTLPSSPSSEILRSLCKTWSPRPLNSSPSKSPLTTTAHRPKLNDLFWPRMAVKSRRHWTHKMPWNHPPGMTGGEWPRDNSNSREWINNGPRDRISQITPGHLGTIRLSSGGSQEGLWVSLPTYTLLLGHHCIKTMGSKFILIIINKQIPSIVSVTCW